MQIRDLANVTGATPRALRYYEQKGLLEPERLANGYRRYSAEHVETVRRIRLLLAAGINTDLPGGRSATTVAGSQSASV